MTRPLLANLRNLQAPLTGVQRYTSEVLARLTLPVERVAPRRRLSALRGHAWEQFVLPWRVAGRLLWSPANTGPVTVARQVATIHDASALDHPEWFDRRFGAWYAWMLPRLARRAAHVITDTEFSRARLIERCGIAPDRISAIHLGVDPRFAHASAADIHAARTALGVPTSRYLLTLGTLEPRKNLGRVIDAWRVAQEEVDPEVVLVLAGGRGLSHVFRGGDDLRLPPRVHLTERVPGEHLPGLLAGAEAFFTASVYEGFGLPPLEAATAGTAVVASDIPAHREVLGDGAAYFAPHATDDCAHEMTRIVADSSYRAQRVAAARRAATRYSWDGTARTTQAILEGLL